MTGLTKIGSAFTYNPTIDAPALNGYTGTVMLHYRVVERDDDGHVVDIGPWTTGNCGWSGWTSARSF
ncbi:MAG TPA: hypothetical protein VFI31_15345 [Pirellulales bacterium]|nr:hypothetical protein [Pirellulales bacterium]